VLTGEERAIVTPVPGTTRDHIEVPLSLAGVPIVLVDTAGLRETGDEVEAIGVTRAHGLIDAADILLWLGEPAEAPDHPQLIRVHAKADLPERQAVPSESVAVSALTGEGLRALLERVGAAAGSLLPPDGAVALNRRQAALISEAAEALAGAAGQKDAVLLAEDLRHARTAFDRLTGRAGVEEVLEALFGRFCLGK